MEAKINKVTLALGCLGAVLLVGVGAWAFYGNDSQGRNLGILCFGILTVLVVIVVSGIILNVKRVSSEGLQRRDGRGFNWADLEEVKDIVIRGRGVSRTVFRFKGGSAWLSPVWAGNYSQVRGYVRSMMQARGGKRS